MYEHKTQPLAPLPVFYGRLFKNLLFMTFFLALCLGIGTWGYYYFANLNLVDAFLNASMILSGMGPVLDKPIPDAGKIFSSLYALFSGVAFITNVGFFMAPAVHRFFHKMHLEEK
ncbi:MAG TPA: hypothetical protein PKM63_06425 [Panacibacter sp.]|nr:hypothetical protein [Panacibacter sp.]HNP43902.1 hypothetical protein [Panacibacter sp.]